MIFAIAVLTFWEKLYKYKHLLENMHFLVSTYRGTLYGFIFIYTLKFVLVNFNYTRRKVSSVLCTFSWFNEYYGQEQKMLVIKVAH